MWSSNHLAAIMLEKCMLTLLRRHQIDSEMFTKVHAVSSNEMHYDVMRREQSYWFRFHCATQLIEMYLLFI